MKKALSAIAVLAIAFPLIAQADPVAQAYDEALAAGRVALEMQKSCEKSMKSDDLTPCLHAASAQNAYSVKSKAFLSSVEPHDLFSHVTPAQMNEITSITKEIGRSSDYVTAYLAAKKK